jgi:hypothetical protein
MKVFRVIPDVNKFQKLFPRDEGIWATDILNFDCTPKMPDWMPPAVYVLQPKLKCGNFLGLCASAFVVDRVAHDALSDLFEMSAELLPIGDASSEQFVVNVTGCFNVLDDANTKWVYGASTGAKIRIERYAFHPSRFTEAPLFKIPETSKVDILTVTGLKDPEDEFKHRVESAGLTGLLFEEIWSNEK